MADEHGASVEVPTAGVYRLDPQRSKVSYAGRHMFGLGVVNATFAVTSGEIRIADPVESSTATVSIDAASFSSGNPRRDKDVHSAKFLDVGSYPTITFSSEGLREEGEHWLLTGTVTAHGTPVPVEVIIDNLTHEGAGLRVHATAEHLDRHAFAVTGGKGMVGRYLDLDLDVFAVQDGGGPVDPLTTR